MGSRGEATGIIHAAVEADTPRASFISSLAPTPGVWNTASAGDRGIKPCSDHATESSRPGPEDFNLPDKKPAVGTHVPAANLSVDALRAPHMRAHPNTEGTALVLPELPPSL